MVTEDYVSFEIAKFLKEKGFEEECYLHYSSNGKTQHWNYQSPIDGIPAPSLQMAMKWLREKHNQNIIVKAHNNVTRLKTIYYAEIQNLSKPVEKGFCVNGCIFKDTYEEAVEYSIRYCLKNLI